METIVIANVTNHSRNLNRYWKIWQNKRYWLGTGIKTIREPRERSGDFRFQAFSRVLPADDTDRFSLAENSDKFSRERERLIVSVPNYPQHGSVFKNVELSGLTNFHIKNVCLELFGENI